MSRVKNWELVCVGASVQEPPRQADLKRGQQKVFKGILRSSLNKLIRHLLRIVCTAVSLSVVASRSSDLSEWNRETSKANGTASTGISPTPDLPGLPTASPTYSLLLLGPPHGSRSSCLVYSSSYPHNPLWAGGRRRPPSFPCRAFVWQLRVEKRGAG